MLFLSAGGRTQNVLSFFGLVSFALEEGIADSFSFLVVSNVFRDDEGPPPVSGVGFVIE